MTKHKIVALVVSVVLVLGMALLTGCQPAATQVSSSAPASASSAPASVAPPSASSSAPAASSEQPSASASIDLSKHEVYKIAATDNAFGGTISSVIPDRASIKKNLPVQQKKNITIGWASPTLTNSYFVGIKLGAETQCKKYGYTLKFLNANNFDAVKQSADIESLVTEKVDLLVVDPADTQTQLKDVQRAVDKGIPVIASGVPFDQSAPVITTVVSSNYEGGYITGQYCAKYYKDPIKMAMIPGMIGHPVTNSRVNGFMAGWIYAKQQAAGTAKPYREDAMLEGYNAYKDLVNNGKVDLTDKYGVNIVGQVSASWDETQGISAAEDLLTANPDISLIYAENDHMGMGAAKVLGQRKLADKIQIACAADGDKFAIEAVRDGQLLCTGYNNPVVIAKRVIDLANMIFEKGYDANDLPIVTAIPLLAVDKNNYQQVYDPNSDYAKELDVPIKTIPEINAGK